MAIRVDGLDTSSLTELIDFRADLEKVIRDRFERDLTLLHTDVVGSTARFDQYGDVTGRGLQQRHFSALGSALDAFKGTLFNTAGDGAFAYFDRTENAILAAIRIQQLIAAENETAGSGAQLTIRAGVHSGATLIDGTELAGHTVNLAAIVADIAGASEIAVSREAFSELSSNLRSRCGEFATHTVKGIIQPVDVALVEWRDLLSFPDRIFIQEMNQAIPIDPKVDVITVGRQRAREGRIGNDIVIRLPETELNSRISRFQLEIHRTGSGFTVKSVTDQKVAVDGKDISRNEVVPIKVGSNAVLSNVATLHFLGDVEDAADFSAADSATVMIDVPEWR